MKKIIFLMGALYVVFLISFKEPKEKQKSFSEIIKDDPSRIKELLDVADSLSPKDKIYSSTAIDPQDVIGNDGELDVFRKKTKVKIGKDWPIVRLATKDMLDIIGDPQKVQSGDSLTFYLGTYKPSSDYKHGHDHSQKRVDRYNDRNVKHGPRYTFKQLEGFPTFIIESCGNCQSLFPPQSFFDAARMCPPPDDGSCGFPFKLKGK